ncbi:hypothetical protein DV738_g1788, partial [Chaetothyriales sp. CBS 135597]
MVLRIRLARFGKRHSPIYNIVVAQARTARDSKPLEVLGVYDPKPKAPLSSNTDPTTMVNAKGETVPYVPKKIKDIQLDQTRTKYWLGVGAQPSEPVERLLVLIGLMEPKPGRIRAGKILEKTVWPNKHEGEVV